MYFIEFAFIAAIVGIVVLAFAPVRKRYDLHAFVKKPLLTDNEREFYGRLRRALPEYTLLTQVSMGALVDIGASVSDRFRVRLREMFNRKIVDFVVCDQNFNVVALIELDDRTHVAQKDALRDTLTNRAGYVTLRYESKTKPSAQKIAEDVLKLASTAEAPCGQSAPQNRA
jgi:very-short-patch-repair endonuclease